MTDPITRVRAMAPVKEVHHALTDAAALRVWLAEHADDDLPGKYEVWGRFTPDCAEPPAAPAQAQGAPWTVVSSPNATPGNNDLAAVATVSANDAWAVGSAENSLGNDQLLAEHWDGTAWTIVRTPTVVTGDLSALAAISTNDV